MAIITKILLFYHSHYLFKTRLARNQKHKIGQIRSQHLKAS